MASEASDATAAPAADAAITSRLGHTYLVAQLMHRAIPWVGTYCIATVITEWIRLLAGQATFAQIAFSFLADLRVSTALAWLFGAGGIGYGALCDRKMRRTIKRYEKRVRELEGGIDPNRSSSNLTPSGHTNPEDLR